MKNIFSISFLLVMLFGLFGCQGNNDFVFDEFERQIQKNGMSIDSVDKDGIVHIKMNDLNLEISLENLRRDYERDKNPELILDFVKVITSYSSEVPERWEDAENSIFISFFPNDFDFKDIINEKVTDEFSKVFVLSDNEKLVWITNEDLKKWNISKNQLNKQANRNADALLAKTNIQFDLIENRKLVMIESEHTSLKGSLLFAPSMKSKIEKEIGFPFYAVLPVRDFCYLFSEKDFDFFSRRLGKVVVEEFTNSGYPVSTEILKFTSEGVETVGKYPVE